MCSSDSTWFNSYYHEWVIVVHHCTPVLCTGGERLRQGLFQQGLTPVGCKLAEAVSRNWIWSTFVDDIHWSCTLDANSVSKSHNIVHGIQNFGCRKLKLRWTGNGTVKELISKLYLVHYLWAWLEPRRSKVFRSAKLQPCHSVHCQNRRLSFVLWAKTTAAAGSMLLSPQVDLKKIVPLSRNALKVAAVGMKFARNNHIRVWHGMAVLITFDII